MKKLLILGLIVIVGTISIAGETERTEGQGSYTQSEKGTTVHTEYGDVLVTEDGQVLVTNDEAEGYLLIGDAHTDRYSDGVITFTTVTGETRYIYTDENGNWYGTDTQIVDNGEVEDGSSNNIGSVEKIFAPQGEYKGAVIEDNDGNQHLVRAGEVVDNGDGTYTYRGLEVVVVDGEVNYVSGEYTGGVDKENPIMKAPTEGEGTYTQTDEGTIVHTDNGDVYVTEDGKVLITTEEHEGYLHVGDVHLDRYSDGVIEFTTLRGETRYLATDEDGNWSASDDLRDFDNGSIEDGVTHKVGEVEKIFAPEGDYKGAVIEDINGNKYFVKADDVTSNEDGTKTYNGVTFNVDDNGDVHYLSGEADFTPTVIPEMPDRDNPIVIEGEGEVTPIEPGNGNEDDGNDQASNPIGGEDDTPAEPANSAAPIEPGGGNDGNDQGGNPIGEEGDTPAEPAKPIAPENEEDEIATLPVVEVPMIASTYSDSMSSMQRQIDNTNDRVDSSIAMGAATAHSVAGLHLEEAGDIAIGAGLGHSGSAQAVSLSLGTLINNNFKVSGSVTTDDGMDDTSVGMGFSYRLKNRYSN